MLIQEITSANAPKAIGPYTPAVKLGDFVYMSGQIPVDPASGEIVAGGIQEQTHQVLKNIEALLADESGNAPYRQDDGLHDRSGRIQRDERDLRYVF